MCVLEILLFTHRLSGIIHVLYNAMNSFLSSWNFVPDNGEDFANADDDNPPISPISNESSSSPISPQFETPDVPHSSEVLSVEINEEEANMSVALTEYFQDQRAVYDQVRFIVLACLVALVCLLLCIYELVPQDTIINPDTLTNYCCNDNN